MEITTATIVNSSPLELVILSYEVTLENIKNNIDGVMELDDYKVNLAVAKAFIKDLNKALDLRYEVGKRLHIFYRYINSVLIASEITSDKEKKLKCLKDADKLLRIVYEGFKKIKDEEKEKTSVMSNTDTIYAGLTYGVKGLNETVVASRSKGLRA